MRGIRMASFIGGLLSFILIMMTYTVVAGVFIHLGLDQSQKHFINHLERNAKQFALQLANEISKKDPLQAGNVKSFKQWEKKPLERMKIMGTAVFSFPGEDNLVEAFFLSSQGQVIATNQMLRYADSKEDDKSAVISKTYNQAFFHRGTLLQRAEASLRMVPKEFPLQYDVILGEKNLAKYRLTMNTTTELPISAMTLFIAKYINQNLESPVIDATVPVFGNDDKVLGSAHYMVHVLPLYAYIEEFMNFALYYYMLGAIAAVVLALILITLLILTGSKQEIVVNASPEMFSGANSENLSLSYNKKTTLNAVEDKTTKRKKPELLTEKQNELNPALVRKGSITQELMIKAEQDLQAKSEKKSSNNDKKRDKDSVNANSLKDAIQKKDQNEIKENSAQEISLKEGQKHDQIQNKNGNKREGKSEGDSPANDVALKAQFIAEKREKMEKGGYKIEEERMASVQAHKLQEQLRSQEIPQTIPMVVKKETLLLNDEKSTMSIRKTESIFANKSVMNQNDNTENFTWNTKQRMEKENKVLKDHSSLSSIPEAIAVKIKN